LLTVQLGQESTQEQTSLLIGGTSGVGVPARGQFGEFAQEVVTGGGGHQRRLTFLVHQAPVQVGDGHRAAVLGEGDRLTGVDVLGQVGGRVSPAGGQYEHGQGLLIDDVGGHSGDVTALGPSAGTLGKGTADRAVRGALGVDPAQILVG